MSKVIKYMGILFIIGYFITLLAAPPGGGENGWREFSAFFSVSDPNGNPISGVQVRFNVEIYGTEGDGYDTVYGTTNSSGYVYLSTIVYYEGYEEGHHIWASIIDGRYTVISSYNTYSNVSYDIDPDFDVIFDLDKDIIDDGIETEIAEKFKPVLHKNSYDLQQGLQNFDNLLSDGSFTLKVYNDLGSQIHNEQISGGSNALHKWDCWYWDTYGYGSVSSGMYNLDLSDSKRYLGAPQGQRPLYYHVYKDENYYYIQYWYYFGMNDLREQLDGIAETWHESDWEHITIALNKNSSGEFIPFSVNFYCHEGGITYSANECWWSATNAPTYTGIRYNPIFEPSETHIHVWISANSHASYNRYAKVYKRSEVGIDYQDRVDYESPGYDLYFTYDNLEKLGEVTKQTYIKCPDSDYTYEYHCYPLGSISKHWLGYVGRLGDCCDPIIVIAPAPQMPSYESLSHGWMEFTFGYPRFGNYGALWVIDTSHGD